VSAVVDVGTEDDNMIDDTLKQQIPMENDAKVARTTSVPQIVRPRNLELKMWPKSHDTIKMTNPKLIN
jgi:hypothetical protein